MFLNVLRIIEKKVLLQLFGQNIWKTFFFAPILMKIFLPYVSEFYMINKFINKLKFPRKKWKKEYNIRKKDSSKLENKKNSLIIFQKSDVRFWSLKGSWGMACTLHVTI